ncbi:MAG: arginine deiminase-related protein, partial [Cyclobacteriaceae bacterium]
ESNLIYHTNVMMWIGGKLAATCPAAIKETDRDKVMENMEHTGREILRLTHEQVASFAGNMLEMSSKEGNNILVMSEAAWNSLTTQQQELVRNISQPLAIPLRHIEKYSGGSARCMMAGIHLPGHGSL